MIHFMKNKFFKQIALLTTAWGLFSFPTFAADIAEHHILPQFKNCQSATYISDQWNEKTKKAIENKALAYKKLICTSGREAFILIQRDAKKFNYKLVDHGNEKLSEKAADMCLIVNKYCSQ